MNKIRLIPVLFIKNGFIVRSQEFIQHKIIGNVVNQARRYNQWDVDELIFIDISRIKEYDSKRDDHKIKRVQSLDEVLSFVSNECFMPLTFGGGIRDLKTIKKYITNGADKVIINTLIHTNPSIIRDAVSLYGSQAIVASVDYRFESGKLSFYIENGTIKVGEKVKDIISLIERIGAGEIFLNSISKDGTGNGYDIEIIKAFIETTNIPVVACGGAALYTDFVDVAKIDGISGVAAGNLFHFTENIYPRSKTKLIEKKLNFRKFHK